MVQPNEYQDNAFDQALTYKIEFDLAKKGPITNLMVEYTKMLEVEHGQASFKWYQTDDKNDAKQRNYLKVSRYLRWKITLYKW